MAKIEMLDKLTLIREAVAALPDDARPLLAVISYQSYYIHLSSLWKTPEATSVVEVEGASGPHKEYRADVLGAPAIWLEI